MGLIQLPLCGSEAVSYTHLDVYKRQGQRHVRGKMGKVMHGFRYGNRR